MANKETFLGEVAKQLPVKEIYNDVAHPALSTVGVTLQGATRVALAPITAMVWGYDKIAGYLDVAIPEYFANRKISEEKIVSPDPAIAVPTIEAMRYTSHKEELREMFVNLLGAAMNSDEIDEHPSFVEVIKQLSSDECKILKHMQHHDKMPMLKERLKLPQGGELDVFPYFSDVGYLTGCSFPQKFPEYLNNLHRLGLVDVFYDRYLVDNNFYEDLKKHFAYPKLNASDGQEFTEKKSLFVISEFGKIFCKICIG